MKCVAEWNRKPARKSFDL